MKKILLCAFMILASSPALACGIMEKSEPRAGSSGPAPERITLTFSEAVAPASSHATLTDASGHRVAVEKPAFSQDNAVMALTPAQPLAAGTYKLRWNVLWEDCDSRSRGSYRFTVKP